VQCLDFVLPHYRSNTSLHLIRFTHERTRSGPETVSKDPMSLEAHESYITSNTKTACLAIEALYSHSPSSPCAPLHKPASKMRSFHAVSFLAYDSIRCEDVLDGLGTWSWDG
jgi:hypothetical protein